MLSNLPAQIQQEIGFIRPMVEERFAKMEEYGEDWDDKPVCWACIWHPRDYMVDSQNDLLMWFMNEAKGVERSVEGLARRLLVTNFVSIHTTSMVNDDIPSPSMMAS
jgi:hypothetical protein